MLGRSHVAIYQRGTHIVVNVYLPSQPSGQWLAEALAHFRAGLIVLQDSGAAWTGAAHGSGCGNMWRRQGSSLRMM